MKKVLLCNEFSMFSTGYATYGQELLTRLHQTGKYQIAEFASYLKPSDKKQYLVPWQVYGNEPETQEEEELYNKTPLAEFGAWKFEQVALDFRPDVVLSIRDEWMDSFIANSPFRKNYKWLHMATVDAEPQLEQWLETYSKADGILTYTQWGQNVLRNHGLKNLIGITPPSANQEFVKIEDAKDKFGLLDITIVGTVMRNQRRKLYPNLFKVFREVLDKTKNPKLFLYCHTSYPDAGWDIPYWIKHFDISTRVLFTYICTKCYHVYPSMFSDAHGKCVKCGSKSILPGAKAGVSDNVLSLIYNCFDLYIQYANSEGFGMPQAEAAACGVPIMATDYSAMHDVVRKLNGVPLPVLTYHIEPESGCNRAIPDDNAACDQIIKFVSLSKEERIALGKLAREGFEKNYNWNTTAETWMNCIDAVGYGNWNIPSRFHVPPTELPVLNNEQYVDWLICDVLGEPELRYSYMAQRLLRDINYGFTNFGPSGYLFNEQSLQLGKPRYQSFTREDAYNHIIHILKKKNFWENKRCSL